jgi:WD40 repeat protein
MRKRWRFDAGGAVPSTLRFSPDDATLFSFASTGSNEAWVWPTEDGRPRKRIGRKDERFEAVAFSASCKRFYYGSRDGRVGWRDIAGGENATATERAGHRARVKLLAVSDDDNSLASVDQSDTLIVWDVESGEQRFVKRASAGRIGELMFSPDGNMLISIATEDTVPKPADLSQLSKPELDKFYNAFIREKSTIQIWDAQTGELRRNIRSQEFSFGHAAYSGDGGVLAVAQNPDDVVLFDSQTCEEKLRWSTRNRILQDLAISPNGEWLATAGRRNVQLWELKSGKLLYTFTPTPLFGPWTLEFSHDGSMLATGEFTDEPNPSHTGDIGLYDVLRGN